MDGERLETLQKSVIQFADALFEFQPEAVINITEFAEGTKKIGCYRKKDTEELRLEVNCLTANGRTHLFSTTLEQLSYLTQSTQHNNVLLFTDGEDTGENQAENIEALKNKIISIQQASPLIPARNKFFIISYDAKQPEILKQVTQAFASPVIETNTAEFTAALSEKDKLQEWAAARELFTCRLEVTGKSNSDVKSEEYVCSYDMSGQFTPLASKQIKNNETLCLTIMDGNGRALLDDKKSFAPQKDASKLLPGTVEAATQHGIFASQNSNNLTVLATATTPLTPSTV